MATRYMKNENKNLLDELVEQQLSSVEFVQDYLQLHFDDKTLTCYIWPIIKGSNFELRSSDSNYKNKLCDVIGKKVNAVSLQESESLIMKFIDGYEIVVSLDPNNPEIVSEIAVLSDNDNNWLVFE